MTSVCMALLCGKATRKKYCREHRACAIHEVFGEALRLWLVQHGADFDGRDTPPDRWRCYLVTVAGRLRLSFYAESFALYTQFDDADAGARACGATRPSGKWNHHMSDGNMPEDAAKYVIAALERLVVKG